MLLPAALCRCCMLLPLPALSRSPVRSVVEPHVSTTCYVRIVLIKQALIATVNVLVIEQTDSEDEAR